MKEHRAKALEVLDLPPTIKESRSWKIQESISELADSQRRDFNDYSSL